MTGAKTTFTNGSNAGPLQVYALKNWAQASFFFKDFSVLLSHRTFQKEPPVKEKTENKKQTEDKKTKSMAAVFF